MDGGGVPLTICPTAVVVDLRSDVWRRRRGSVQPQGKSLRRCPSQAGTAPAAAPPPSLTAGEQRDEEKRN